MLVNYITLVAMRLTRSLWIVIKSSLLTNWNTCTKVEYVCYSLSVSTILEYNSSLLNSFLISCDLHGSFEKMTYIISTLNLIRKMRQIKGKHIPC